MALARCKNLCLEHCLEYHRRVFDGPEENDDLITEQHGMIYEENSSFTETTYSSQESCMSPSIILPDSASVDRSSKKIIFADQDLNSKNIQLINSGTARSSSAPSIRTTTKRVPTHPSFADRKLSPELQIGSQSKMQNLFTTSCPQEARVDYQHHGGL